jgi:predicted ATP-grasp superfamily ATP-dependent carboligase
MPAAPALVLGQGLTVLGTVRCFGRAGVPVYVLTEPDPLASRSRWFRQIPGLVLGAGEYGGLAGVLARLPLDRGVLVPCSDRWAEAVGRLDPELRERFPTVVPGPEVVAVLVDKGRLEPALETAGVPHPQTFPVATRDHLDRVPDDVLARGFLKPRDSVGFYRTFGVKAFDFRGRQEAEELLGRAEEAGLSLLLQEYIPGRADQHYFIDGVATRDGRVPVLFARRRLRIHPPRFGNSSAVVSVPLAEVQDAVDSLRHLISRLGLHGIFSAEFKRDARDGRCKLLEVNPRPWWYVEFAANCGADVCVPAYRDALGLPVVAPPAYRRGARLVYPYYDWQAWRLGDRDQTSLWELARFWCGARQAEWCWDDPAPGWSALGWLGRAWLGRNWRRRKRGLES